MIKKWSVSYPAVNGTEQRRAYVYLPTMYEAEPDRRFPVLYMFDGQNVFFDEDATYGKSWGVADYLDYTDTPLIVAAVECNAGPNNERLVEYSPYRFDDPTYGHFDGKGQATMSWYIHRFKPFIDRSFRTLPDREHTFIGGSSMGGLMSLYALLQYNGTFSRAAALSPSIWVAPDKLADLVGRAKLEPGTVLYMDYGSREMGNHDGMHCGFAEMCSKVLTRGIHLTSRIVPGGTHSEASWEKQLPFVFHTLMYELERYRRTDSILPSRGGSLKTGKVSRRRRNQRTERAMEMQYFKDYSPALGRDMECKIYGHAGRPMLYIPCQDGRFFDFEDFHMADTLAPWIESGQIMVLSIDTLDKETWSDTNGDPYWRIRRYEQWLHYIVDEAVPKIRCLSQERNGWDDLPGVIAFGCSLGATHAVNLYLRRPDIFCGCLALSGIYTAHYGFGDYMDELVYQNSPVDYMRNFPTDHPYMELYRNQKAVICCGQGAWEQPDTTWYLKRIFEAKGIPVWVDLWGHDVKHDWDWWYKQVVYYMPYILGQQ